MRILLVADGRSPITRRWLLGLARQGQELHIISSFPCDEEALQQSVGTNLISLHVIPVAFGRFGGSESAASVPSASRLNIRRVVGRFRAPFMAGRYWLGPLSVLACAGQMRKLAEEIQPDLIHALRIPFEGMLASYAPVGMPLVVSIWGNDLTLHARGSAWMSSLSKRTLRRAQGLMADTQRDLHLVRSWGFSSDAPVLLVPGSGGLDLAEIRAQRGPTEDLLGDDLSPDTPVILNPRGFRTGSVRNDTFFQAIPDVLRHSPQAIFICPAMAGQVQALGWVKKLGIKSNVRLLPYLSQPRLWDLFHRAQVSVSVSVHDGTPNTLLEAMACGCFPVVGDIEPLREWVSPGVNGLLVDPDDPKALADAIISALEQPELRKRAAVHNTRLVTERADHRRVMEEVEGFYRNLIQGGNR